MKKLIAILMSLSMLPALSAGETGSWKAVGKVKLPSPAVGMTLSEDNRQVLVQCLKKIRRDSGGFAPGFVTLTILHSFAVDTGKELFSINMSDITPQMSLKSNRLAVTDTFDKVTVYDVLNWKKVSLIDTRTPVDSPPGSDKGVPAFMKDFGGGGRVSDIELTGDGKVLVVCRNATTGWKMNAKGTAWTAESFQQLTFWDTDKGTKLAFLDCEDKNLNNGHLTLLPKRNQMLAKFDNGVRLLDLSSRKWGKIFPVQEVYFAAVSSDEQLVAVTDHEQGVKIFNMDSKELLAYKERVVNKTPRFNGPQFGGRWQFGPTVQFVDEGKCLRVTLNDGKTVLYRDVKTGDKAKRPASEDLKLAGLVLAISPDRRFAVTVSARTSTVCTIWQRTEGEKK